MLSFIWQRISAGVELFEKFLLVSFLLFSFKSIHRIRRIKVYFVNQAFSQAFADATQYFHLKLLIWALTEGKIKIECFRQ